MLSPALVERLNDQLNFELESAYVYFSMAAYMEGQSLDGFAHWMKLQAEEEIGHAMRIYKYLTDLGANVTLEAIKKPPCDFSSVLNAFETALKHEENLARRLNEIAGVALSEKDNTTYQFLDWFLTEQVEEISSVGTVCDKLRLIGDNGYGILMLNTELGARQKEPAPQ
ncbi:MAG: ferritin [Bdellovibrionales bacterium]|nr:ferritin [Bdellovibrionales bacterium]